MDESKFECPVCGIIGEWTVQESSDKAKLIECNICGNIEVLYPDNSN